MPAIASSATLSVLALIIRFCSCPSATWSFQSVGPPLSHKLPTFFSPFPLAHPLCAIHVFPRTTAVVRPNFPGTSLQLPSRTPVALIFLLSCHASARNVRLKFFFVLVLFGISFSHRLGPFGLPPGRLPTISHWLVSSLILVNFQFSLVFHSLAALV